MDMRGEEVDKVLNGPGLDQGYKEKGINTLNFDVTLRY
jgi:hypothetical protein